MRATQKRLGDQQSDLDLEVTKSEEALKAARDTSTTKQTALSNASTAVATITSSLNSAKGATPANNQSIEDLEHQLQGAQRTQQQASTEYVQATAAVQKAQGDNEAAKTHRQQEIARSLSEVHIQINAYRSALVAVEKIVRSSNQ